MKWKKKPIGGWPTHWYWQLLMTFLKRRKILPIWTICLMLSMLLWLLYKNMLAFISGITSSFPFYLFLYNLTFFRFNRDPYDDPRQVESIIETVFPDGYPSSSSLPSPSSLRIPYDPSLVPSLSLSSHHSLFLHFFPKALLPLHLSSLLSSPPIFMETDAIKWEEIRKVLEKENPGTSYNTSHYILVNSDVMGPIRPASVMELRDDVILGNLRVPVKEVGGVATLADTFLELKILKTFHHIKADVYKTKVFFFLFTLFFIIILLKGGYMPSQRKFRSLMFWCDTLCCHWRVLYK